MSKVKVYICEDGDLEVFDLDAEEVPVYIRDYKRLIKNGENVTINFYNVPEELEEAVNTFNKEVGNE